MVEEEATTEEAVPEEPLEDHAAEDCYRCLRLRNDGRTSLLVAPMDLRELAAERNPLHNSMTSFITSSIHTQAQPYLVQMLPKSKFPRCRLCCANAALAAAREFRNALVVMRKCGVADVAACAIRGRSMLHLRDGEIKLQLLFDEAPLPTAQQPASHCGLNRCGSQSLSSVSLFGLTLPH